MKPKVGRRSRPIPAQEGTVKHPLIGKYIQQTDETRWRISRVDADLGNGLLLLRHISPRDGEEFNASYIQDITLLVGSENAEVYDTWQDFWDDMVCYCPECKGERIHFRVASDDDDDEDDDPSSLANITPEHHC